MTTAPFNAMKVSMMKPLRPHWHRVLLLATLSLCWCPGCNRAAESTLTQMCNSPQSFYNQRLELDLSGQVSTQESTTAVGCPEDPSGQCTPNCNWTWVDYIVKCEAGGTLLITTNTTPFGRKTASWNGDDSFGTPEVTLGCQGDVCSPTCVPESTNDFGQVEAHLEPADGYVGTLVIHQSLP